MAPRQSRRVADANASKASEAAAAAKVAKSTSTKAPKANTAAKRTEPKKAAPAKPKAAPKNTKAASAKEKPVAKTTKTTKLAPAKGKAATNGNTETAARPTAKYKKVVINPPRYTKPLNVYVFGEGSSGELGLGASRKAIDVKRPRLNDTLVKEKVVRIATGGMHCVALTLDNRILTWGVNDNGALGRDTTYEDVKMVDIDENGDPKEPDSDAESEESDSGLNPLESTPTAIDSAWFPEDTVFVDIAAGDSCSFALTDEGYVYGWGCFRKNEGVLGFTKDIKTARVPMWIEEVKKVKEIVCGTNHVLALDASNRVWAWGSGQQNQLARRMTERSMLESVVPTHVGFKDSVVKKASKKMVAIASGDYHGFAIGSDGHVWSWGVNNYGETGHPDGAGSDNASISTATVVQSLEGIDVEMIKGGSHHNLVVTKDGRCLVWGRTEGSVLGLPIDQLPEEDVLTDDAGRRKILLKPTAIPKMKDIVYAACGPDHNIAIDSDGKSYSWGFSATYQTGQGTDDDIEIPTLINNTAVREKKLTWAGCGGQYSVLASESEGPTETHFSSFKSNGANVEQSEPTEVMDAN
ncbi:RCC1/BLIP-II [Delitschia confertaspora ATCC 74209]|uniref:RCC1/BLIP-II n=1 Tax=Delitschia confertaspora ATCC 74209 TaxID=1513339 RepID=A0A9P4JPN1_9PLEO|nr:RCC1/BLIP-II [Delitschia confertaspora ATCC 74209]